MRQTVAIVISLFLVFLVGLWGQYVMAPDRFAHEFLTAAYETVMLFALGGDWTLERDLPWQLELARMLAPVVSVAGILIVLTRGAWVGISNLIIRFWQEHVVVVGLSDKGWQFATSCGLANRTVIIERNPDHPLIERARSHGLAVIVGDMLEEDTMVAANLKQARHLVTFCGDDGTSVELAIRVREYLARQGQGSHRLRIHLHVNGTRVSSRLETYAKFYDTHSQAEVDFFSVHELTARILLRKYPPDTFAQAFGQRQVHLAFYHFGPLAEQIMTEAIRICHFLNGTRLRFSIFDPQPDERLDALLARYPGISQLSDIEVVKVPRRQPISLVHVSDELLQSVTSHVLCLDTDDENLELALSLRSLLLMRPGCNAPINVYMQHASGLARLLESNPGEPEIPDGIYPFGMLNEVLDYDNILSDRLDELAQAIHEDFLHRRASAGLDPRLYTSLNPWRELPEPERKSNRLQADHLAAKLRAIRCRYGKGLATAFAFTPEEASVIARMEHDRWRANKIYEGWRQGTERIEGAKVNPFNVPWDSIDATERQEQVEAIMRLPEMLQRRLGWRIQREYYIGVTGHRPHRLNVDDQDLRKALHEALDDIVRKHPDKHLILVSPLAEGADRLVARMALEHYNMNLHVPLPLPYELYQTDFATRASLDEFKELVGKAESYFELPTAFGTIETLASHVDGTPNPDRNRQYALVGAYIAQTCDEMIAVYDGGGVNGTGGTGDIIDWRQSGPPPEYRNEADFAFRPTISPPRVVQVTPR